MREAKRFAAADSVPDLSDTAFRNKRVMPESSLDVHRAEPSQQPSTAMPSLDAKHAESSRQHVRALNTQFASWIQTQLKNHPDELWEGGVRDYLAHASDIMEKFSDVVNWLKQNAVKGGSVESLTTGKQSVPEIKNNDSQFAQGKTGTVHPGTDTGFTPSWSSGAFSNNQSSGGLFSNSPSSSIFSSSQSTGLFSKDQTSGLFSNSQSSAVPTANQTSGLFSNSQSSAVPTANQTSGLFSNSQSSAVPTANQTSGLFSNSQSSAVPTANQTSGLFSNSQSSAVPSANQTSGFFSNSQSFGGSFANKSSGLFSNSQSLGLFSNSQSSGLFSNNQSIGSFTNSSSPILFGQNSAPTNDNTSVDADDENELEQPSSPSVKKSEEKGIVVVHEVKCKLYVKSSDPADKDTWKDKGTGQLSIKCKEGISKGTKESKPTIVVRNDVGRVLLNALLYPGIRTNAQKNSLVAIFHTAGDDGGNNDSVVARTFLIRTKTEEDRSKLATAIQEYAPTS